MKGPMRRLALLILGTILAPGLAAAALQGENLLVPPLAGWIQAYAAAGNGIRLVEYVPKGQTADAWSQMATIEIFFGRGGMTKCRLFSASW